MKVYIFALAGSYMLAHVNGVKLEKYAVPAPGTLMQTNNLSKSKTKISCIGQRPGAILPHMLVQNPSPPVVIPGV